MKSRGLVLLPISLAGGRSGHTPATRQLQLGLTFKREPRLEKSEAASWQILRTMTSHSSVDLPET